ncbi:hypothetical protein QAD02_012298 [Eretmocerus hayati]|uniref:Uncharacterized protein n=1 Tax=Eretmocerus hayati TaxID=131215 RepID=A0ACC2P0Z8_9HYME|nr:hypothetical protein QAD02_012298 [Eretmocerus hayati]
MSSSARSSNTRYGSPRHGNSRRNGSQRKPEKSVSYFVPPPRVRLPKFPVPKDLVPVIMHNLKPTSHMTEGSIQYLSVLEIIKSSGFQTTESNHLRILKLLLYVEEIANNIDMRRYNQYNKSIERFSKDKDFFKIYVDGLMEERPSVRPEDLVEIRDAESNVLYVLRVINVMDKYLLAVGGARFCQQHRPDKQYNISFRFGNYTFRCCHFALSLINQFQLTPLLFPVRRETCPKVGDRDFWFNESVKNNPQQKQAVLRIANKSSFPAPYILYGPPGTGKTATVVEAICQIYQSNPSDNILVCTPSNSAGDVITRRLLNYIPDRDIYRMYSPSKEGSSIDEAIVGCSNFVDGQVMMLPREIVLSKKILICTLCAATRLIFMRFRETHFSYIFIDEAGQATEPDTLIPFNLSSSCDTGRIGRLHGQVIISGDPQQLGPGIRSKIAEPLLGRSMLERLMDCEPYKKNEHGAYNPSYITKLIRNYRSHPLVIRVSNELFYDQELESHGPDEVIRKAEDWKHLVKIKFPIIFHGVEGTEKKDERSPSVYNVEEIKIVVHYVRLVLGSRFKNRTISQKDIGIITPFSEQRRKLHQNLEDNGFGDVEVGTVELFQGREKDIIILSTVRSRTFFHDNRLHIGFLSNPKRFNVALTRAKALLIVVGNPTVLQTDKYWWYFLKFCLDNKACRGMEFIPNSVFENEMRQFQQRRRKPKMLQGSQLLNDSNLEFVEMDDGVTESSDDSVIDENEYPAAVNKRDKNHNQPLSNNCPRSENLLSDIIQKMGSVKIDKQAAKKNKKKNKAALFDN